MRILHTADLHIGADLAYLGSKAEKRRFEVLEVFKNICALCRKDAIDICLIAGDLFDSPAAAKIFFSAVCEAIASAGETAFFYVCGNHDPLDASSPFRSSELPENLQVFGTDYEVFEPEGLGVRVMGKSFAHSFMEAGPCPALPHDDKLNILLLHGDFETKSVYAPIDRAFIENCGADYLALGHIHTRTEIERVGNTFVSYPGCPEGQGFDEVGLKGVYAGELRKGLCEMSFVPTSLRQHIVKTVDVTGCEDTAAVKEKLLTTLYGRCGEGYKNDLYKLILTGRGKVNTAELYAPLSSELYFVKLKDKTRPDADLLALSKQPGLRGLFVKNMLEKINAADEAGKAVLSRALYIGLEALEGEVAFDEDNIG